MSFQEISCEELKQKRVSNSSICIIDVRESYEFEDSNIGGKNIPMAEILEQAEALKENQEIHLCCASGKRSKTVAYHLAKLLPENNIYTLIGGVSAYNDLASA